MILMCTSDRKVEAKMMTHFLLALRCHTHSRHKCRMHIFKENMEKPKVEEYIISRCSRAGRHTTSYHLLSYSCIQHSETVS